MYIINQEETDGTTMEQEKMDGMKTEISKQKTHTPAYIVIAYKGRQ